MRDQRPRQIRVILELPRAEPEAGIRGLRWLLKRLLRGYGIRCVRIQDDSRTDEMSICGSGRVTDGPGCVGKDVRGID
jgi:hypothetical protein